MSSTLVYEKLCDVKVFDNKKFFSSIIRRCAPEYIITLSLFPYHKAGKGWLFIMSMFS